MKWTLEEEKFLIDNYNKGYNFLCDSLGKTKVSIVKKSGKLKLSEKRNHKRETIYSKENLERIIKISYSYADCITNLGITKRQTGYYTTLKKYIDLYKLDINHFDGYFKSTALIDYKEGRQKPLEEILVENSDYNSGSLKKRILKDGLLENICILCRQDENWKDKKISLILDHINGISNDNRLENLRIVCPNCNAGLDTFAGRNLKNKFYIDKSYRKDKKEIRTKQRDKK